MASVLSYLGRTVHLSITTHSFIFVFPCHLALGCVCVIVMVTNICVSLVHIVSLSEQPSCFVPVTARSSLMNNILPVTLMNINLRNC